MWVIKYHVYHSPVLVRIWMCDHKSLEVNVLGDLMALSGVVLNCILLASSLCFFFFSFFYYNENVSFCSVKKSCQCVLSSHL